MCIFGGGDGWLLFMGLPLLFIFLSGSCDRTGQDETTDRAPGSPVHEKAWICPNQRCRCPNSPRARFCKRCRTERSR